MGVPFSFAGRSFCGRWSSFIELNCLGYSSPPSLLLPTPHVYIRSCEQIERYSNQPQGRTYIWRGRLGLRVCRTYECCVLSISETISSTRPPLNIVFLAHHGGQLSFMMISRTHLRLLPKIENKREMKIPSPCSTHAPSVLVCSVTSHRSAPPLPYPSPNLFCTIRPTRWRNRLRAASSQPRATHSLSVAMHRP